MENPALEQAIRLLQNSSGKDPSSSGPPPLQRSRSRREADAGRDRRGSKPRMARMPSNYGQMPTGYGMPPGQAAAMGMGGMPMGMGAMGGMLGMGDPLLMQLQQQMAQTQQILQQNQMENTRLQQELSNIEMSHDAQRIDRQRRGFEKTLYLMTTKLGAQAGFSHIGGEDDFDFPGTTRGKAKAAAAASTGGASVEDTVRAMQELRALPQDSELYHLQMEHITRIAKLRFERELQKEEKELEMMRRENERLEKEREMGRKRLLVDSVIGEGRGDRDESAAQIEGGRHGPGI